MFTAVILYMLPFCSLCCLSKSASSPALLAFRQRHSPQWAEACMSELGWPPPLLSGLQTKLPMCLGVDFWFFGAAKWSIPADLQTSATSTSWCLIIRISVYRSGWFCFPPFFKNRHAVSDAPRVICIMESTAMLILSLSFPFGFSVILYFCDSELPSAGALVPGSLSSRTCVPILDAVTHHDKVVPHLIDSLDGILKALNLNLYILPVSKTAPHSTWLQ